MISGQEGASVRQVTGSECHPVVSTGTRVSYQPHSTIVRGEWQSTLEDQGQGMPQKSHESQGMPQKSHHETDLTQEIY